MVSPDRPPKNIPGEASTKETDSGLSELHAQAAKRRAEMVGTEMNPILVFETSD